MRNLWLLALAATMVTGVASAEVVKHPKHMASKHMTSKPTAAHHSSDYRTSDGKPVDNGPTGPDSDKAYMGGGVILQGAPGAPAPTPMATPKGQMPANAVQR